MTLRTLRKHLMKIGWSAVLLGIALSSRGIWIGNATLIAAGGIMLCGAAYALVYAHVGSF
jgi:hypothetical protein